MVVSDLLLARCSLTGAEKARRIEGTGLERFGAREKEKDCESWMSSRVVVGRTCAERRRREYELGGLV